MNIFISIFLTNYLQKKSQSILFGENSWQQSYRAKVLCRGTIRLSRSLIVISKIPDAKYSLGEYGSWSVVPWVSRQMGKWLEQTTRATVPTP